MGFNSSILGGGMGGGVGGKHQHRHPISARLINRDLSLESNTYFLSSVWVCESE